MPPINVGSMALILTTLTFAVLSNAQQYVLQSTFGGTTFFDNFNFYTGYDPSQGYVHYVDQPTAQQYGMINVTNTSSWGVDTTQVLDPSANLGRLSVRLISKETYNHGLFVLDLVHMPVNQCGTWPAFWTLGPGQWPLSGEIDIIEYSNTIPNDIMALHTAPGCSVAGVGQSGTLITNDCGADSGFTGCDVTVTNPNNLGTAFNTNGGGVYAMEWTSTAIRVWFFPRNAIPPSIAEADSAVMPDVTTFGLPVANFEGSCNIDAFFHDHSLIFDIDFCGQWAGNTWSEQGCPMLDPTNGWSSCNEFVAANPQVYADAYWEVNSLNIYQATAPVTVPASSSLSSVTPVVSTSSISVAVSDAQGQTTTPPGTPAMPTSPTSMSTIQSSPTTYNTIVSAIPTDVVEMCPQLGDGPDLIPCVTESAIKRDPEPQGAIGWCGVPGASCNGPQTVATHLIDDAVSIEGREAEAQTIEGGTIDWCGVPGAGCPENIKIVDIEARDAEPQTIEGGTIDWCGVPGAGCPENIKAVDIEQRDAQTIEPGTIDWCGVPGASCNGRHSTEDEKDVYLASLIERDPQSNNSIIEGGTIDWCGVPGASCNGKFKEPESSSLMIDEDQEEEKRDAEPQIVSGGSIGFCGVLGASCNEKFEDEVTSMDQFVSQDIDTALPAVTSILARDTRFVKINTIITTYKRARDVTTVTCTPAVAIGPNDVASLRGCMADQDANENNAVVDAHTTTTITALTSHGPTYSKPGRIVIAGVIDSVEGSSMASSTSVCVFATIMVCSLAAAAFML